MEDTIGDRHLGLTFFTDVTGPESATKAILVVYGKCDLSHIAKSWVP